MVNTTDPESAAVIHLEDEELNVVIVL